MALLTLAFLGSPQVTRADGTALTFRSRKALALVAYLAVEGKREHSRDTLLGLLWPDDPEEAARNSLRVALANLRQILGEAAGDLLSVNRSGLQFIPDSDHVLDVATFSTLLAACRAHRHEQLDRCPECSTRLAEAVALYGGEFLAGFALPDSAAFQEWVVVVREQLHQQAIEALDALASTAEWQSDSAALCRYARRQLVLEPWREQAHRQLMRGLVLVGDRSAAMTQYATCCRVMESELGIEPDQATHLLYEQIRTNQLPVAGAPPASAWPTSPAPVTRPDIWSDVPEPGRVYGRQAELDQLCSWLLDAQCQVVALLGIGGVGKTTLAAALTHTVAEHFDRVIWRSLLNAPTFDDLLRPLLQALSGQALTNLPASLDDRLALLLDYLRKQRCLLVLDNLESLLDSDSPGKMRPGYEGYAQLLQRLAQSRHASCLLITSRERPQSMARWEADLEWVRALRLEGLDASAGQALLAARALHGQHSDAHALIERYSGHPLALKLVAETIRELFGGTIADFLAEDSLFFDDIRAILDQQFSRLSTLEQDILYWLAIEREPVTAAEVRSSLVPSPASGLFLEALRALQRRSLVEQRDARVALQNVVTEYLTGRLVDGVCAELIDVQALTPATRSLLNRFALRKSQAKAYVRQSQARQILQPIAERLRAQLGNAALAGHFRIILDMLRATAPRAPGYAGGNLLNLLLQMGIPLAGFDFSRLSVWQADLRGVAAAALNLASADLAGCAFTLDFGAFALRFDQSGHVLVPAPYRDGISLWHVANGQVHDDVHLPGADAHTIVLSPDGRLLAGCCEDHTLRIWSVAAGRTLHVLSGHTKKVDALAFSADSLQLASAGLDNTIRLWDVWSGQCLRILEQLYLPYSPLALQWSAQERRAAVPPLLASASYDNTIWLWDTSNGRHVDVLHGHTREIKCLAFAPEQSLLASGAHDGTILLWDVSQRGSASLLGALSGHSGFVGTLAFHPDGHLLASGSADHTIRLWDVRERQTRYILSGHADEVVHLAFRPDGETLASACVDRVIKLWDVQSGRELDSLTGYLRAIRAVRFQPDGRQLASGGADGLIRLWDCHTGHLERSIQAHSGPVVSLAFSPDGRFLASGGTDGAIHLWEATMGTLAQTLHGHTGSVRSLAWSPDRRLLASGGADRTIRLWPLTAGVAPHAEQRARLCYGHTDEVASVRFDADGRLLVSSSYDHSVRLWSADTGQETAVLGAHTAAVCDAAISTDGHHVASIGYDSQLRLWDRTTGSIGWSGVAAVGRVVGFDPRGNLLAHASEDAAIVIRERSTGTVLHTLRGHSSTIAGLDFSATEPLLATSSWDGTVRLWDMETGTCLHTLRTPGPYAGMNISNVSGITQAQIARLIALGAVVHT